MRIWQSEQGFRLTLLALCGNQWFKERVRDPRPVGAGVTVTGLRLK